MAKLQINSYPVTEWNPARGFITMSLSLGEQHPSTIVDIKNVADAERALDAFAEEVKKTGKAYQLSARIPRNGGRAPAGFRKWEERHNNKRNVNLELATTTSW